MSIYVVLIYLWLLPYTNSDTDVSHYYRISTIVVLYQDPPTSAIATAIEYGYLLSPFDLIWSFG